MEATKQRLRMLDKIRFIRIYYHSPIFDGFAQKDADIIPIVLSILPLTGIANPKSSQAW